MLLLARPRARALALLVVLVAAGGGRADATCAAGYTGTPCVMCAAGKYKDAVGTSTCTDCPAGKYAAPSDIIHYLIGCWPCDAGYVSAAGAVAYHHLEPSPRWQRRLSGSVLAECRVRDP